MEFFHKLFDTNGFPPRWSCGEGWTAALGWTHIIADAMIFAAYAAIPLSLAVVVIRRRDLPQPRLWILFATFIFSCGFTHLIEATLFWYPWYRFSALLKVITAIVSVATAFVLARSLPSILSMPGIQRLNTRLRTALQNERALYAELSAARKQLEDRTALITARSRKIDAAIAAAGVVACRWEIESGAIEWEMGFGASARAVQAFQGLEFTSWSQVLGAEGADRLRLAARQAAEEERTLDFQHRIPDGPLSLRLSASPEPVVAGQPFHMTGMFRMIPG